MRIVGVDRIPSTPFDRGDAPRKPGADADPGAHAQGQARARRARHDRSGDLVVHRRSRRPSCSAAARRSSRSPTRSRRICPTCGRASFPASSRPRRSNADRGFADAALFEVGQIFKGDEPEDQFTAASGVRRGLAKALAASAATGRASAPAVDAFDAKARRARGAGRRRRAGAGVAGRARRAGLVSSRPLRHHPDRAAERARPFRRAASARAGGARRRRPARRLRGHPRAHPRAARPRRRAPSRALELSPFQPVTRDFAFVVDARGEGGRHRARRAGRRPQADRRRRRCSTSTRARASRPARSRSRSP